MVKLKPLHIALLLVCWAVALQPSRVDAADEAVSSSSAIVAAIPHNFPPQFSVDEAGRPIGFAIDAMDAIAELAGITVTYRAKDSWRDVQDALINGEAHVIPSLGISKKREEFAVFTKPLENVRISLFVKKGADDFHVLDDISGHIVGAVDANVGARLIDSRDDVQMRVFPNFQEALLALLSGRVDALAYPEPVAGQKANELGMGQHIRALEPPLKMIDRAIAVRKDQSYLYLHRKWRRTNTSAPPLITRLTPSGMASRTRTGPPIAFF